MRENYPHELKQVQRDLIINVQRNVQSLLNNYIETCKMLGMNVVSEYMLVREVLIELVASEMFISGVGMALQEHDDVDTPKRVHEALTKRLVSIILRQTFDEVDTEARSAIKQAEGAKQL